MPWKMKEWNTKNPETPVAISAAQLRSRVRDIHTPPERRLMKNAQRNEGKGCGRGWIWTTRLSILRKTIAFLQRLEIDMVFPQNYAKILVEGGISSIDFKGFKSLRV